MLKVHDRFRVNPEAIEYISDTTVGMSNGDTLQLTPDTAARLIKLLDALSSTLPKPKPPFTFRPVGENAMGIVYDVDLPQVDAADPASKDIVSGRIKLDLDGAKSAIETTLGQTVHSGLTIDEGVKVNASFVWVDNAGNESKNPLALPEFTVTDTVPPPDAVEGLALRAVGEN